MVTLINPNPSFDQPLSRHRVVEAKGKFRSVKVRYSKVITSRLLCYIAILMPSHAGRETMSISGLAGQGSSSVVDKYALSSVVFTYYFANDSPLKKCGKGKLQLRIPPKSIRVSKDRFLALRGLRRGIR